ncbi:MAG TPA: mechanosensitive ion channel domain-containing protein [Sphingobacteriaceae bacterium]|nr:mechanosensitive ion channel domain-containing protein [Sphingobacteriaceae bacterium]
MNSSPKKPANSPSLTFSSKLVFVTKLILVLLIGYSLSKYASFYQQYPVFANLAYGLNTFLTASVLISVGRYLMISWYSRKGHGSDRMRSNVLMGINQIAGILNVIFVILGIMLALDINPKEFLTSITLVAMAIALLFRDYITNMISGLLIMFSDRFSIGDFIKIGDDQGRIIDITLSNIVIRNDDDHAVMIPNNSAFISNIVNQTIENTRKLVIDFNLPLSSAHEFDKLENRLVSIISSMKEEVIVDSVQFKVVSVNHNEVLFKLSFMLQAKNKSRKSMIRDIIFREVLTYDAQLCGAQQTK